MQHGREADRVKAEPEQTVERLSQLKVPRRHSDSRRNREARMPLAKRDDPSADAIEAAASALGRAKTIVCGANAVQTNGHAETKSRKKIAFGFAKERAVRGDGESDAHTVRRGEFSRPRDFAGIAVLAVCFIAYTLSFVT